MELRDYLTIVWKRRWMILISVTILALLGVIINYAVLQPKFQSTAKILVEAKPKMVVFMNDQAPRNMPPALDIETYVKMLKSLKIGEMAAKKLGSDNPQKAATDLVERVMVEAEEDTGIIRLSVTGSNPQECTDVANAYSLAFEQLSREMAENTLNEVEDFIHKQLKIATDELDINAESIQRFQHKILKEQNTTDPDIQEVQLDQLIRNLEVEKMRAQIEIKEQEAKLKGFDKMLGTYTAHIKADVMNNLSFESKEGIEIDDRLRTLELEEIALSQKYMKGHPKLEQITKQIDRLQAEKRDYMARMISGQKVYHDHYEVVREELDTTAVNLELARAKLERIQQSLTQEREKLQEVPAMKKEKRQLEREMAVAENLKNMLEEQLIQTKLQRAERPTKVRVLDKAFLPTDPVSPKRKRNIAIFVIVGLLLGIGGAFLLEEMEESIRTSDDVKNYLNLPVLGSIPYSAETINKLITDVPLKSPIAEAYRRLSFFTQLFCLDPPIKSLLITSSKSDEGKSTTLSNMAISMAQEGTKVLIVDTDLRRPMLHRMFGIDNSLGLSSILTGELEAEIAVSDMSESGRLPKESFMEVVVDRLIQPANIKGLSIIPSGPLPANSIELLRSERMLSFLRTAEKKADIVIFDSPPAIHVIDAVVLSQILDGVLLIINSGRINREEALQVKYMIESTKTPIIGVALNNIEASSPDYYYYYYYGGYGYGSRQRRKRVKLKR